MADIREVFTIIENDSTGAGEKLPARTDGGQAATGNHMGVLAFKDNAGDDVKPQLTASGAIPTSPVAAGTSQSASAAITVAALATEETVASITVANDDVIDLTFASAGSLQPCFFVVYKNDNGTRTEQARFVTGPGDYQNSTKYCDVQFTMGAAGAQTVELRVTQIRGPLSDAHGTIAINNLG